MAVKPTTVPEYARNDVVDPDSGVNNVVEPSEAKKDLGHGPQGEYPPRQYQNWFMRWVGRWLSLVNSRHAQFFVATGATSGSAMGFDLIDLDPDLTVANTTVVAAYFDDATLPSIRWKPDHKFGIWISTSVGGPTERIVINGASTPGWPFRIILMKINYSLTPPSLA